MSGVTGILGVLALILAVSTLFIATFLGRKRAIEESGYRVAETPARGIELVTRRLFDQDPGEIYVREEIDGQSWLIRINSVGDDLGCTMVLFPFARNDWPEIILTRNTTNVPEMLRTLTGGFISLLDPISDSEAGALADAGWEAHRERGMEAPKQLTNWLYGLTRLSGANRLVGIAVCGPYLVAWADSGQINALLKVGAKLPARLRDTTP